MKNKINPSREYFARAPSTEIAKEIKAVWSDYHRWLESSGQKYLIQTCYDAFYNFDNGGFGLSKSRDGSSVKLKVQHLKSIIERIHSLVTQAKLSFNVKSNKSDAASLMTSDFGRGLLEYINTAKNMDVTSSDMVETGLIALDSYIYAPWDFLQGERIRDNHFAGDQSFKVLTRFDVASHKKLKNSPYYIVRELVNRYDLAAQYPNKADQIMQIGGKTENEYLVTPTDSQNDDDGEMVEIYTLIHDKTLALPNGRLTIICGDGVLDDVALPYRLLPVVHFQPGKIQGSVLGDSPITSLVSIQQGIDALYGAVLSNNLNYARQNIWSPSPIQVETLSEGFNNIVSAQEPKPLQLVASSPETYNLINALQSQQQILSGIGNVARSNPESSLKSGTSLALMLSIAVQHVDSTQKAYAAAVGKLASIVIANHQQFATEPRLIEIGGVSKKSFVKSFTSKDLEGISRVSCDVGNPLTQNMAGRMEFITNMMQMGVLKDPVKITEFMRTGQTDSLTEDTFKDSVLIRSENEMMLRGENPIVLNTDNHPQHIIEHKELASDPAMRNNPQLMMALNQHQLDHLEAMKNIDPDLAAILGLQPLPSQQQALTPPPGDPSIPGNDPNQVELPAEPGQLPEEQRLPNLPQGTPPEFEQGA
jgi:hypothetical protein